MVPISGELRWLRWASVLAAALVVVPGCAGRAPAPSPTESDTGSEREGNTAVATLTAQARSAHANGQPGVAAAKLERALRLEPRDPALWHRLAMMRLAQGRPDEAESLALKSLRLTDRDGLKRDNWRLIADARRRAGDPDGARRAESRLPGGTEESR